MSFESLQPVMLETIPERIAEQIRTSIIDGSFAPGTQLTEAQLAGRLAVSRGPVREAMQRLIQEGLLRSERHRGVFVMELDACDVTDIYLARAAIERAAVRELFRHEHRDITQELETAIEDMTQGVNEGDWRAVVEADLHFHEIMVDAAESKRLSRMFRTLLAETRMCLAAMKGGYPEWRDLVAEHRALLQAFRNGDEQEIVGVLDSHFRTARINLAEGRAST